MAKSVYLAAMASTVAIVLFVFFFAQFAETQRVAKYGEEIRQISLESEFQSAYSDFDSSNKEVYCTLVNESIKNVSNRLSVLEKSLQTYKNNSFNSDEFYFAKKSYLLTSMILYRNLEKAKVTCDLNIKTVLFFYAEDKSCEVECGTIGAQLDSLSRDCNTFKNFNYPYNWPAYNFIKILEVKYGVKKPGILVVDGELVTSPSMDSLKSTLGCN